MKNLFKYTLPVVALCALAACSEDISSEGGKSIGGIDVSNGKELIALSQEGGITRASLTRAGGFGSETRVVMCIKAEDDRSTVGDPITPRYARAVATASAEMEANHSVSEGQISHSLVGAHSDLTYNAGQERYWDDAFGRHSLLTIWALAIPNKTTESLLEEWNITGQTAVDGSTATNTNPNWRTGTEHSSINWTLPAEQTSTNQAEKDLAYSNNISSTGTGGCYRFTYSDGWSLMSPMQDGQMKWIPKDNTVGQTTGKFDQGHLIFYHALSKIVINLTEDAGFANGDNTDFKWTKNKAAADQNITLKDFNTSGSFNVSTATWTCAETDNDTPITTLVETTPTSGTPKLPTAAKTIRTLEALVVPENNLWTNNNNVIEFEIDNAQYYVTGNQIATAIRNYYAIGGSYPDATLAEFTTTKPSKKYIINLKVSKKKIEKITAAVVDWEEVNSEELEAQNTYPSFNLDDRGEKYVSADANEFRLYRAAQTGASYILDNSDKNYTWPTGYITGADYLATKNYVGGDDKIWGTTNWFWPDNLTYYHFRAVGIHAGDASTYPEIATTAGVDKFNIKSGILNVPVLSSGSALTTEQVEAYNAVTNGSKTAGQSLTTEEAATYNRKAYMDYTWGAPFENQNGNKIKYNKTNGFDGTADPHQISYAIGATTDIIHMLMFHMTSQITVNVKTSADASAVTLQKNGGALDSDKTKVEILRFLPDGTVNMGTGLVTPSGTRGNATMTYGTYNGSGSYATYNGYTYGVVPQPLTYESSGTVGMRITTPDGNQYLIPDLSTIEATVTTAGGSGNTVNIDNPYSAGSGANLFVINQWYPNFKYTYNITVTKKGIERITAAVVDWETVESNNINIDLEN